MLGRVNEFLVGRSKKRRRSSTGVPDEPPLGSVQRSFAQSINNEDDAPVLSPGVSSPLISFEDSPISYPMSPARTGSAAAAAASLSSASSSSSDVQVSAQQSDDGLLVPRLSSWDGVPARERFCLDWPAILDRVLLRVDEPVAISLQQPKDTEWKALATLASLLVTALFSVEIIVAAPFALFAAGYDDAATAVLCAAVTTALGTQLPKRFLFRPRPYMTGVVECRREDATSSFPSRAVSCAAVYSVVASFVAYRELGESLVRPWMAVAVFFCVVLAALARMNLGVHYLSDCVAGAVQGLGMVYIGVLGWQLDALACPTCLDGGCYAAQPEDAIRLATLPHFFAAAWWRLLLVAAVSIALVLLLMVPPVRFWTKADRVFGLLMPCLLFQLNFLCPGPLNHHFALPRPDPPGAWYGWLYGVTIISVLTLFTKWNAGRLGFLLGLVLYVVVFFALATWRIAVVEF